MKATVKQKFRTAKRKNESIKFIFNYSRESEAIQAYFACNWDLPLKFRVCSAEWKSDDPNIPSLNYATRFLLHFWIMDIDSPCQSGATWGNPARPESFPWTWGGGRWASGSPTQSSRPVWTHSSPSTKLPPEKLDTKGITLQHATLVCLLSGLSKRGQILHESYKIGKFFKMCIDPGILKLEQNPLNSIKV